MLSRVVLTLQPAGWAAEVVSMLPAGLMAEPLRAAGIPVHSLQIRRGVPDPRAIFRLRRIVRNFSPDLIQTWMYHADLLGGVVGALEKRVVVWNVRHSNLDRHTNSTSTLLAARVCALTSRRVPRAVIYCSHAARETHEAIGYDSPLARVLPNGFDLARFAPDAEARRQARAQLGVGPGQTVIGLVARYHPQKDHRTFIEAARRFGSRRDVMFVMVGAGIHDGNRSLTAQVAAAGLGSRVRMLGERDDVHAVMQAFDIATSSSVGEGFPNVIGEAMACGIPCVVTDVGDSARLVGDTGLVVPPSDPVALAEGWRRMDEMGVEGRAELGRRARDRMEKRFSIEAVAHQYAEVWREVMRSAVREAA